MPDLRSLHRRLRRRPPPRGRRAHEAPAERHRGARGYGGGHAGGLRPGLKRLPPFEVPRTEEEDRRVLLDALEELGEHAESEGTLVLLEPLNRYEDHMLNRVEQAVELCQTVGRPSIKVMGDLFHMNIEEDDLGETIRRAEGHLAHVHLADSNRLQPGAGHTDFAGAFDALHDIGFDGYMAMECGIRGDAREVLS